MKDNLPVYTGIGGMTQAILSWQQKIGECVKNRLLLL